MIIFCLQLKLISLLSPFFKKTIWFITNRNVILSRIKKCKTKNSKSKTDVTIEMSGGWFSRAAAVFNRWGGGLYEAFFVLLPIISHPAFNFYGSHNYNKFASLFFVASHWGNKGISDFFKLVLWENIQIFQSIVLKWKIWNKSYGNQSNRNVSNFSNYLKLDCKKFIVENMIFYNFL